jgi:tRNA threonylcarbamoyladenosine biosynthesis protein TsaE
MPGDVLLLEGPLGAGKTCLVQGIAFGLGVTDYVKSPSFTLVNEYQTAAGFPLYHIDLYRITEPGEERSFGLEDYLNSDGICAIEWPGRVRDIFKIDALIVDITLNGDNERQILFSGIGQRYQALVEKSDCF